MNRRTRILQSRRDRLAFTLIELLVVIMIIGILTTLLMAGFNSAITAARVTEVVTEIKNLEKAISDFKLEYGIEPPSYFVLYEDGEHYGDTDADAASHGHPSPRRSREIIRKLWPSFLDTNNETTLTVDFNFDGDTDDVFVLNGAECLVFFLGGRWIFEDANGNSTYDPGEVVSTIGFSASPNNPFEYTATLSNRTQFYTFDSDKLLDIDGDLMPEYADAIPSQTMPYQYFSSYDGAGYRPYGIDGVRGNADDETLGTDSDSDGYQDTIVGPEAAYYSAFLPRVSYEPKSFQIISPGFDAEFFPDDQRPGGANERAPDLVTAPGFGLYDGDAAPSALERDNITNFKGGRLN